MLNWFQNTTTLSINNNQRCTTLLLMVFFAALSFISAIISVSFLIFGFLNCENLFHCNYQTQLTLTNILCRNRSFLFVHVEHVSNKNRLSFGVVTERVVAWIVTKIKWPLNGINRTRVALDEQMNEREMSKRTTEKYWANCFLRRK